MSKIYRFKKAIILSDGTILGNNNPARGPLGGECFFDKEEDNEVQNAVRKQIAEDEAKKPKKDKEV